MTDRLPIAAMALIWLALPATMCGQELQVTLRRIVVEVGMAEGNVLKEAAAKKQRVTTMPGDDRTAIVWDGEAVGKTGQSLGSIVFRAGKVNSIFKRWTLSRHSTMSR